MALFTYEARNIKGELRKGRTKATSLLEASQKLKEQGFRPMAITEQAETLATKDIEMFNSVGIKDLVSYLQQFSTLIDAGVSITDASFMLAEQQEKKNFQKMLLTVAENIQGGQSLSDSYLQYPKAFPPMLISVIRAAEISGTLETTLNKMAIYFEKKSESQSSLITAMIYPIMMLLAASGVGVFLMVKVVPMFVEVFEGLDAELPAITKVTMKISDFLTTKGWVIALIILAVVIGIQLGKRNAEFRYNWDGFKLRLPLVGELTQKSNVSTLMSTLSTLLSSSVPISQSLEMSRDAVTNLYIKQIVIDAQMEIERGGTISSVFANTTVIPSLVAQMIRIGENTGALESMLAKLSHMYEVEVETAGQRIKTVMEPLIILLIATMVGFIVAAVMLPMFAMYGAVQG